MALGTPVIGTLTYSTAGGGSVSPTYPASITSTDALVLFIGQKPATANGGGVTTPTGWTLQGSKTAGGGYGATLGSGTGNSNVYVYTKDTVTGSESGSLAVTLSDNSISWGAIIRVPTGGGTLSFATCSGEDTTAGTPLSVTGGTDPGFISGDLALYALVVASTAATLAIGAVTATGATFGSAVSMGIPSSGLGNQARAIIGRASCTAGPSSAAPIFTATVTGTTTNARGPGVLLRIREAVSHASSGVLTGQIGSVSGTAQRNSTHASSGAVVGPGATLSGVANRFRDHASTGVIVGPGAVVAGSAARIAAGPVTHASSGALIGPGSTVNGVAVRFRSHASAGSLVGSGATIAGSALRYRVHDTAGDLFGPGSIVEGSASRFRVFASSGALVGPGSLVDGVARRFGWSPTPSTGETWTGLDPASGNWVAGSAAEGVWSPITPNDENWTLVVPVTVTWG